MALVDYKKYQVLINSDSKKVQGLKTGDIIRRQYFDGENIIYSLMCVLSSGIEKARNESTGLQEERPYFIGALLEGDELNEDNKQEILDFARITNLFDTDRLGALYLTASDDEAPFMDVVDGIGKNCSLSWPEGIASEAYEDSQTQYVIKGVGNLNCQYTEKNGEHSRVITITRASDPGSEFEGLRQDFYQFIQNNNQVLISYKIRGSKSDVSVPVSLCYSDGLHTDAAWNEDVSNSWTYKFRMVTVGASGRHLRSFKMDFSGLWIGDEIQIADLNIILLSSIANFGDSSASRIGKLDGVVDGVFGRLTGYGAYLQKLYASRSAHISGTLTAGDENGFGATFYAGKIHRNSFINSLSPDFNGNIHIEGKDSQVANPTGIGNVYRASTAISIVAQNYAWITENAGKRYCFSFWLYMKQPGRVVVMQNLQAIGEIEIRSDQTHEWRRVHTCFDVLQSGTEGEPMLFALAPNFAKSEYEQIDGSSINPDERVFFFSAPQLESGDEVTQYQATDGTLDTTEEYGAWFNRGGIGGTMQNPLLQLNYKDDEEKAEGGIGTRSKSFLLRQDGSGYLANKNISWDEDGKVTFDDSVTLNWDNLGKDAQDELANRYCRILGEDMFTIVGLSENASVSPSSITLTIDEVGFSSTSSQRQWMYRKGNSWSVIPDANAKTLVVTPDSEMWGTAISQVGTTTGDESTLTVKCVITLDDTHVYSDTKTLHKQCITGYTVEIVSSGGRSFKNGTCRTTLTANVYYQGSLVDPKYVSAHYKYVWNRYNAATQESLWKQPETASFIELDYELNASEIYTCEIVAIGAFRYSFPVIL